MGPGHQCAPPAPTLRWGRVPTPLSSPALTRPEPRPHLPRPSGPALRCPGNHGSQQLQEAPGPAEQPSPPPPPLPPPPPPPGELARSPEAAGPELEAEEKLPARVVEPAAAAPQERPDLPLSPAPPPEQPPAPEERQEQPLPQPAAPALVPPAGGDSAVSQLIPGSEVRVTLDHIIEDALVVSFRLGEKLFSGVLMDLSKRYRARPQHAPGPAWSPGRERTRAAPAPRAPAACTPSGPVRRGARAPSGAGARGRERAVPAPGGCL